MGEATIPAERSSSLRGAALALLVAFSLVYSLAAIIGSYSTFNHSWDEPAHIAAGVELLDRGTYDTEPKHPPIARLAVGFGPWLLGADSDPDNVGAFFTEGNRILYETGDYEQMLTAARLGNLPFFLLILLGTGLLARRLFGLEVAICSIFFAATTPILLGNAAVATLDIAPVAFSLLTLYALIHWLDAPGRWNAAALGACSAAAILSKFSALPFLVMMIAAVIAWRYWLGRASAAQSLPLTKSHLSAMPMLIASGLLVTWASYGFQLTSLADPQPGAAGGLLQTVSQAEVYPAFLKKVTVGLIQMVGFSGTGHPSYLLGETGSGGWPHYYLVGLLVRTPLPLLGLGLAGLALMVSASRQSRNYAFALPALAFLAIMIFVTLTSSINIGIRHILIVYPLLAIGAGYGISQLCSVVRLRIPALALALVLAGWQFAASLYAHPDQLTYFNILAGNSPERILINADLDWGQDLDRLSAELKARGATAISIDYNGSADPARHDLPQIHILKPDEPVTGWIAVSLFHLAWFHNDYAWLLEHEPVARVGKSIDLYFIPDDGKA
jgi:hypothetical protein